MFGLVLLVMSSTQCVKHAMHQACNVLSMHCVSSMQCIKHTMCQACNCQACNVMRMQLPTRRHLNCDVASVGDLISMLGGDCFPDDLLDSVCRTQGSMAASDLGSGKSNTSMVMLLPLVTTQSCLAGPLATVNPMSVPEELNRSWTRIRWYTGCN